MKRLSGWDAVLLYSETPTVHMHTLKLAVIEIDDLKGRTFGIDEFREVIHGPAPQARPVPVSARRHPAEDAPPDVAGELRGRPRIPRPPVPRRQSRRPPPAGRGGRQDRQHARWTAASRCGRCTSSRVWPTAGSRCSARSTTRWPTVWRRPTCWRGAWTCRTGHQSDDDSYATDPAPSKRELVRSAVRRPHAPHRPAARCDALHRAGHRPGAQEHARSSPPN